MKIKTLYSSCGAVDADCIYSVSVDETYEVKVEGWYNVIVAVCYEDLIYSQEKTMEIHSNIHSNPVVTTTGSIAFKNPFGYLPAEAYGLLPFEVMRAILYMLFAGYFVIHYFIYNQVGDGIAYVSVVWFDTVVTRWSATVCTTHAYHVTCSAPALYGRIYCLGCTLFLHQLHRYYTLLPRLHLMSGIIDIVLSAGEPNCCPYPTYFILLNVLQILNATLLRLVLLIICLGYGIGRPRLLPLEIASISVLHLLYFIAASANQIYYFVHLNSYYMHSHMDYTQGAHYFRNNSLIIFEIVINAMLLSWIYISASSTIRILREFQQREKLKMYQRLMTIIYAFIFLFMVVTGLYILGE